MDGMLIFAGLFSASLTAFIIESYKKLSPDSSAATLALLAQISDQLAGKAGNSTLAIPATPFVPATTALICNALWFISLGLSLSSALIATLLEQWARDFLHRADLRSAPIIRARIFSYLYYGLQRFNIHMVVEFIPLLLHLSLLFFFAGLVLFLLPVNNIIMGIAAALFGLFVVVYSVLTFLPLIYLDCPYRTPLSGLCWRLLQTLRPYLKRRPFTPATSRKALSSDHSDTMAEAMVRCTTEASVQRAIRDQRALIWTVKALTDEVELEPFVESIPDALWGPNGRRRVFDDYILGIANDPEAHLVTRIEDLLRSCDSGLLSVEIKERRQITCLKALWAIASLAEPTIATNFLFDLPVVRNLVSSRSDAIRCHASSVYALAQWHACCTINQGLHELLHKFGGDPSLEMIPLLNHLFRIVWKMPIHYTLKESLWQANQPSSTHHQMTLVWAQECLQLLQSCAADIPCRTVMYYLAGSARAEQLPFRFLETHTILRYSALPKTPFLFQSLERLLLDTSAQAKSLEKSGSECQWCPIDEIFSIGGSIWQPDAGDIRMAPRGMLEYMNWRQRNTNILDRTLASWDYSRLFPGLVKILEDGRQPDACFTAMWTLSDYNYRRTGGQESVQRYIYDRVISAIYKVSVPFGIQESLLATMKCRWLDCDLDTSSDEIITLLKHPMFPSETAAELPAAMSSIPAKGKSLALRHEIAWDVFQSRRSEAHLCILADLLDTCRVAIPPERAAETIGKHFKIVSRLGYPIHESHQLRLASSIQNITLLAGEAEIEGHHQQLLRSIFDLHIFDKYVVNEWLTSRLARDTLKDCFVEYAATLASLDGVPQNFIKSLKDVAEELESANLNANSRRITLERETRRRELVELLGKEVQAAAQDNV
ncbi:hypothetical protein C8J57DRAFT_1502536 [Mycena rebaudengoi]|nr:hypothetical protein C8J57DRAFT_1502536 [Mycena rebaudengoi]